MLQQCLVVWSLHVFPCTAHPLLCINHTKSCFIFLFGASCPSLKEPESDYRDNDETWALVLMFHPAKRQEIEWLALGELSLEFLSQPWQRISWGPRVPKPFREQDHFCVVLWNELQRKSVFTSSVNSWLAGFGVFFPLVFNEQQLLII